MVTGLATQDRHIEIQDGENMVEPWIQINGKSTAKSTTGSYHKSLILVVNNGFEPLVNEMQESGQQGKVLKAVAQEVSGKNTKW
ncbi:hypothetical protein HAX54_020329 [Datura stramonium]|uniref:Uncharacterized protein n=1 Tax=Datura stramonium TaxID=4076 RepID=A0ABS8Y8P5_DATST|nr:hypothetical protein [Datura stramonium]